MEKVFIIAEAGVNHNGDLDLALKLVDVAVKAKADAVKFQTAVPELVMIPNAKKASYQEKLTGVNESQLEMARRIHLPLSDYKIIKSYCDEKDILFLSTPFDLKSIDILEDIDMPIYKIPSGEITNLPYLIKIASFGKPVIMSTGMSAFDEVKNSFDILTANGINIDDIVVLHCNSEYPTPYEDVNLLAMLEIASKLGVKVGYSDHTEGIEVPIAAVALGARVIEKHFTLDRDLEGPDHRASLDPNQLIQLVNTIRNVEKSLSGSGVKVPSKSEKKNTYHMRKSIYFSRKIKCGEVIQDSDLVALRPADGLSPMRWGEVVGKKLLQDVEKYDKVNLNMID